MRERLAKLIAVALTLLVVAMAAFFARQRNPVDSPALRDVPSTMVPATVADPALVSRGRAVFEDQSCERCHSVEGSGNPRSPLDGVGARLPPAELRAWATGSGAARALLTRSAVRAKAGFGALPEEDLRALVAYLSSLR